MLGLGVVLRAKGKVDVSRQIDLSRTRIKIKKELNIFLLFLKYIYI